MQHADSVGVAAARARHDRRLTGGDSSIRVRARLEQELHERRAAIGAGARERRHAEIVRDVGVGARADQQVGGRDIVPVRRPQERRGPIIGPDVHVSLATEQCTNSRSVLRPGRVHEPGIRRGRGRPLRRHGRDGEHQSQRPVSPLRIHHSLRQLYINGSGSEAIRRASPWRPAHGRHSPGPGRHWPKAPFHAALCSRNFI